jgi:glucosamine--fructose-6-phosphate aminotransferase (isomerizing)
VSEFRILEGRYLRDLLGQPQALEDTVTALDLSPRLAQIATRLQQGEFRNVILTGMGSSYHALHPLVIALIAQGFSAWMVETSELVHYQNRLLDARNLIVAVSQSGESAELLRLLASNGGRSALVGVTNTAESTLAQKADALVLMRAGEEFSVSCKTYLASLVALHWLGAVLSGSNLDPMARELAEAAPAARKYLADWKCHVLELGKLLENTRHLFLVGRGPSLAAVGTGALVVKESDRFPAEGMSSAAFRHGPLEMLSPEMFVLIFSGDGKTKDLNDRLLYDIEQQQGRVVLVSEHSAVAACRLSSANPALQPILEILPVQMITLALAAAAGREPGQFEFATKVTTTE